jgi:branched-chain amino acid transport system substrate-binding protein
MLLRTVVGGAAVLTVLAAMPAPAQQKSVKIGFVSTFSGPTAVIGNDMRNSFELALDHLGRKMGGLPVEVIYENDEQRPDVGRQKTEKLIQSDRVNFVVGYIWSNVLLASLKPVTDSQTFLISANAGPSQIAGELCSPFFFSTSWQNDQTPQAMGEYMNQKGVKTVYLIGPNYAAGKDMLTGVRSTFKGKVIGEDLTQWPGQLDFSTELSKVRAAKPEAVFVFYPGAAGVQFLNQYAQSGLRGQIPLYTAFTIDSLSLPLQKDLALGVPGTQQWVNDLPNDANKKFVADFRAKHKAYPSFYGAQSYDAAFLLNSAVTAVKGDLNNKDGMRNEMRKANYASVRGPYRYGNNHFPIQNFYLQDVVKDAEGNLTLKTITTIVKDSQDQFHTRCRMKW